MDEVIKIPISELQVGMEVVKFDKTGFTYPHYGKPFPDSGLRNYLRSKGVSFAYIRGSKVKQTDEKEDAANEYMKAQQEALAEQPYAPPTIHEITQAMAMHQQAKEVTTGLLQEARLGKMINTDTAKNVVTNLVDQCIKSPEAFVNITRLKDYDNYTFTHSVNVSVLAIAIGRRLGCSGQEMNNLGFAGLLHDIGKMKIPEHILNKPSKLTDSEYGIMKQHAALGYEYLKQNRQISEDILMAVRHHHEKSDGTGYPDGLTELKIPKFAKIISIADVYDAITSERVYHKGMMPSEAVKAIFSWSGKHFNNSLVKFFISIMGIYPVGTLVVLSTNELAVIMEPNKNDPMRPKVLLVSSVNMEPIKPALFDLTAYNIATQQPYKSIISALDPRDFSIDTNYLIEQYLRSPNTYSEEKLRKDRLEQETQAVRNK